jgi:hypothetical protein
VASAQHGSEQTKYQAKASSLPGVTWQSILSALILMGARVKPAHDEAEDG